MNEMLLVVSVTVQWSNCIKTTSWNVRQEKEKAKK